MCCCILCVIGSLPHLAPFWVWQVVGSGTADDDPVHFLLLRPAVLRAFGDHLAAPGPDVAVFKTVNCVQLLVQDFRGRFDL